MQIRTVEAIPVSHELEEGRGYGSSRGTASERSVALVRLTTDDGIVGWGEAFAPPKTVATLIEEQLADDIVGIDPYEVESLCERAYTGNYHFSNHAYFQSALSGVDLALWDIIGKSVDRPIHKLLGGKNRTELTPYASTMYVTEWGQDPAEPIEEAAAEGFTAAKIKIGRGIEDDVERVRTAREILGEDAHLMVDFNGNYRADQAIRSAKELSEFNLTWIEEPVPPESASAYRKVTESIDVPVAAGEAHYGRFEFKRLAEEYGVTVLQPNIGRCGGFSEARAIYKQATAENAIVRPHVWNSGVGLAAAIQLAAAVPDYPHSENVPEPILLEFDRSKNPLRHELLETPFDPTGGSLAVPQEPGLGVTVDEAAVETYRID